jgi:hypothetical protein
LRVCFYHPHKRSVLTSTVLTVIRLKISVICPVLNALIPLDNIVFYFPYTALKPPALTGDFSVEKTVYFYMTINQIRGCFGGLYQNMAYQLPDYLMKYLKFDTLSIFSCVFSPKRVG